MSLLHLGLETPPEVVAEELLLVGEVDDALLHPGELGCQELLELGALRVNLRVGPSKRKTCVEIIRGCEIYIHYSKERGSGKGRWPSVKIIL